MSRVSCAARSFQLALAQAEPLCLLLEGLLLDLDARQNRAALGFLLAQGIERLGCCIGLLRSATASACVASATRDRVSDSIVSV